jgi:hypothetical protein
VADLRWNETAGRFTDSAGRFVSQERVRAVIDSIADQASARMAAASERLMAGELSLASWQAEGQAIIKTSMLAASVLAHGGAEQMTFSHYGSTGRAIRDQYDYLRGFADDIASGRQPLNGGLTARAGQYGQAARVAYEREYGRDQQARGYQFERNVLHAAEHCAVCVSESGRGWVPIGSLIPIGGRICRSNDHCTIAYARTAEQAA